MMKKTFFYAVLLTVLTFVGCSDNNSSGITADISVDPGTLTFEYTANSASIEVTCDVEWTLLNASDWVSVSTTSGNGSASIIIAVDENKTGWSRSTNIILYTIYDTKASIEIEQDAEPGSASGEQFSVEITSATSSAIIADIDPTNYSGTWYIAALDYDYYTESFNSPEELAEMFMEMELTYYYTDLSIVDDCYVFQGEYTNINLLAGWGSSSNTKYAICIFGMDASGSITTEITYFTAWTAEADLTDFTLECLYSNITSTTADFAIHPSDEETYYVFSFYTAESIESFFEQGGTDGDLYQYVLDYCTGSDGTIYAYIGSFDLDENGNPYTISDLSPSCSYSFVGYGLSIDSGYVTGRCTDAQIYTFSTTSSSNAPAYSWSSVEPQFEISAISIPENGFKYPVSKKSSIPLAVR